MSKFSKTNSANNFGMWVRLSHYTAVYILKNDTPKYAGNKLYFLSYTKCNRKGDTNINLTGVYGVVVDTLQIL